MLADGRVALVIDRATLAQAAQSRQEFEWRTIDLLRSTAPRTCELSVLLFRCRRAFRLRF